MPTRLFLQADGKVLIGGLFGYMGPHPRNNIARVESSGGVEQTFNLNVGGAFDDVFATAVQPDGKIIIGGFFSSVLGVARTNIARLNPDGTLDTAFKPHVNGTVFALAVQPDGKILVGGIFQNVGGQARTNIARIDGTIGLPDAFAPNANDWVLSIAVLADGGILAGGYFTAIGGESRQYIARLDATTGLAHPFNANANERVLCMAIQADGKILVGGMFNGFNSIGGTARNGIARLDPVTGVADLFNPGADNLVWSIAVQADGRILVGGEFTSIGGQARNHIARLDPATGLADSFNPNASRFIDAIALQSDGRILVGGGFTNIGGQSRHYVARLDPITGLADSFDPRANHFVNSIALQADGKVLISGYFTNVGGQARNLIARLNNDTVAQQTLAVTQSSVTWTLTGSALSFTRVIFEHSSNNVNYTLLGNGTWTGSNWMPADSTLSLPVGQNIYVRARGYYPSAYLTASQGSIQESVRSVFFPTPPLRLNIQRSGSANVVLSWPTNFTGFILESKTNLNTGAWSVVSPAPVVSGANNLVTNPANGSVRFYRLRK